MYVGNSDQLGGIGDFFTSLNKGITSIASPISAGINTAAQTAIQYQQLKTILKNPAAAAYYPQMYPASGAPTSAILAPVNTPLSKAEMLNLQTALKNLGIDPGPLDGIYGPKTGAAIQQFQSRSYMSVDGQPSRALYNVVMSAATGNVAPPSYSQPVTTAPPVNYQAGSTGERFVPGTTVIAPATETALSSSEIATLQASLAKLGIDPGPIDGKFGPKTSAAIQQFQSRNYMPVDGKLSRSLYIMATSAAASMPAAQTPTVVYQPTPSLHPDSFQSPKPTASGGPDYMKYAIPAGLALLGGVLILKSKGR